VLGSLRLNSRNGGKRSDARRLRDQMERLFRARISFENNNADRRSWLDMTVAPKGEFWWSIKDPEQTALWESRIQLGQDFFDGIIWPLGPSTPRQLHIIIM